MICNKSHKALLFIFMIAAACLYGCTEKDLENPDLTDEPGTELPDGDSSNDGEDSTGGDNQDYNAGIEPWDGEKANDESNDIIDRSNVDIYHEANTFTEKVIVRFNGSSATVTLDKGSKVKYKTDGAYVTVDMLTNSVANVEVVVSGKSNDGQLKIYGDKKFKLTLNGLDLTSSKGPAINDQCKKRVFVHLAEGTTNRLTDCTAYSKEPYYLTSGGEASEDRKGCFFSEGNMIFSGTGVLVVAGKYKHGIVTDNYMWIRPGVTIAVTEAAKNAVHVKGDTTDGIGFYMAGGLLYTNVASTAGKGIKTDLHAVVANGKLVLNQSGNAIYEDSENDTSSAAGIKTDGNVTISGGTVIIKSTGTGGKGINATGTIEISGGETTVTTTGDSYYKSRNITSSPKGVKAEGNIDIKDGTLNIEVTGMANSYGSPEGMETKAVLTIDGGDVYSYATDDALNAISGISINGGRIYAYSTGNDGIDSNGYFYINGGLAIANGAGAPEESFDCDNGSKFIINGGTIIGTAGNCMQTPSSSSKQRVVVYRGLSLAKDDCISILNPSGEPTGSYKIPRSLNGMVLFYSTPDIKANTTYTISKNGKLTDSKDSWNGWYPDGSWSGGTQLGTFTSTGVITVVGQNSGGGWPGGRP